MLRIAVNGSGINPGLDQDIAARLRAAGARPERLAFEVPPELGAVDALVLMGGEDIDPSRYGEARHPNHEPLEAGREAFDFGLLELALSSRIPVLAICLGAQELWVHAGGSLIQDIPSQCASSVDHRAKQNGNRVTLARESRLANAFNERAIGVYCNHHQGFAEEPEPKGLIVTARSDDGLIEGFETTDPERFVVAVGWHPERPPLGQALFSALVQAAAKSR